ncbi:MAG: MBL fold metallo-hydrolase [Deltaproteobacteria bacterium]|nr:MBL fold metallo-hydrolase [Deltaproteobacteria bacterium]
MSETPTPNTMIGLKMPDVAAWSERVSVALGQNPSLFTGPGTNTYLVGTGRKRILLDPGQGMPGYLDVLERAMEQAGCEEIQEIVLTHGHPDHIGGVASVMAPGPATTSTTASRSPRSATAAASKPKAPRCAASTPRGTRRTTCASCWRKNPRSSRATTSSVWERP